MNPELEEQLELDRLIAEQEKDDTHTVYRTEAGHREDISIEGMENAITVDEHGEVAVTLPRERGSILTGSATWHGTVAGYTKHKCKCERCTKAHRDYKRVQMRNLRARRREEAAS